ncbi:pentapeptide repeat-containing protein [Nostoc sphaeroides CHAB 2801]|uniref:pentapeptide repeat-containing protein n=1 Tax=Nostoc sphaeroides TaxID=446679 RepID=UPI001E490661|nr:pentapeptide repeat-containing protein [Nostoc sphaeroides]MCC5630419.1 pentapeptide repeat-containing protein [Nostoc sphaeroides CHAB 2801]
MKIKWRSHLKPKPKKRRPSSEEDILHLRRTGRYIPPPRKTWRDKFIVVVKSAFEWIEKRLLEPLANLVDGADVFRILEKVGFLIAVLVFLLEIGERREKSIFEAWQVVKDGQGEKSGVVVLALERLKKENFSLSGINVEKTNLSGAYLSGANLSFANLSFAYIYNANLNGASLMSSNLSGAKNLTPEQVKSAKNWEQAIYDKEFRTKLGLPPEPMK